MKRSRLAVVIVIISICAWFLTGQTQELSADRVVVPFSDPGKSGVLEVSLIHGGITINGYEGKEVIVEARTRTHKYSREEPDAKGKGMKRIQISSTGLTVEEEDNVMSVSAASHMRAVDLTIQVPRNTSIEANTVNGGELEIRNVQGEIQAGNTNGGIKITNVSGVVVANTTNGDVVVSLNGVEPEKPMSFVTFNGDVDVTFPGDIKADVKMKSAQGDIFSDYDISLEPTNRLIKEEKGGKYLVRVESTMHGKINGGGPEFYFSTFNGDIYIRKVK